MLETIREFALEELGHSREEEELRRRHAAFFLIDRLIATTGQALDEAGFGWARAEGRGLLFEEVLDLACEAAGVTTEASPR